MYLYYGYQHVRIYLVRCMCRKVNPQLRLRLVEPRRQKVQRLRISWSTPVSPLLGLHSDAVGLGSQRVIKMRSMLQAGCSPRVPHARTIMWPKALSCLAFMLQPLLRDGLHLLNYFVNHLCAAMRR